MKYELIPIIAELIEQKAKLLPDEHEAPHDFPSTLEFMQMKELKREIETLEWLLEIPDTFTTEFKTQCQVRSIEFENNFGFDQIPDTPTNQLYWEIADVVFAPQSMKEMLSILLPNIKQQIRVDLDYVYSTTSRQSLPKPILIEDNELETLDNMQANLQRFRHFVFDEETVFDANDIHLFSLTLQTQLQTMLLQNHPNLAQSLYKHNTSLNQLSQAIRTLNSKGKKPKEAIEQLVQGLTLGGEKMTGNDFASQTANDALEVFFTYWNTLPKDLQNQLKALEGTGIRLGKVINDIEQGKCVETTAANLHTIVQNNSLNPLLNTTQGLTPLDIKQLNYLYGPQTQKDSTLLQTFPQLLLQKALSKITVSSMDELISLLLHFPPLFYENLWQHMTIEEPKTILLDLASTIRQGFFNSEQKIALAESIAKHYQRFKLKEPILLWATRTNDVAFFQKITSHFSQTDLSYELQRIYKDETIFHYAVYFPLLFEPLLALYPSIQLLETFKAQNDKGKTIFHRMINPNRVKKVLGTIEDEKRLEILQIQNDEGQTALHRGIKYPETLRALLECLPENDRFKAAFLKNDDDESVINAAIEEPQALKAIIESLPIVERFKAASEVMKSDEILQYPESLKIVLECLLEKDKLLLLLENAGKQNFIDFILKKNPEVLELVFNCLSDEGLFDILLNENQEPQLFFKMADKPKLLKTICERLPEKVFYLVTVNSTQNKTLFNYEHSDETFNIINNHLTEDNKLEALRTLNTMGLALIYYLKPTLLDSLFEQLNELEQLNLICTNTDNDTITDNQKKLLLRFLNNHKNDCIKALQQIIEPDRKTALSYIVANQQLLKITYDNLTQEDKDALILFLAEQEPKSLNDFLELLPAEKRVDHLLAATNEKLIQSIVISLPSKDLLNTALTYYIDKPPLIKAIFYRLPQEAHYQFILHWAEQKPESLKIFFEELTPNELIELLFSEHNKTSFLHQTIKDNKLELFKVIFNSLPEKIKLQLITKETKNTENLLHFSVKENTKMLDVIFNNLSDQDLLNAVLNEDKRHNKLLFKITKTPNLLKDIFKRLPNEVVNLVSLKDKNDECLLEHLPSGNPDILFELLTLNDELEILRKGGEPAMYLTLCYFYLAPSRLERLYSHLHLKDLEKIIYFKHEKGTLLDVVISDKKLLPLFEFLIKALPSIPRLKVLEDSNDIDDHSALEYLVQNEEHLKIIAKYLPSEDLLKVLLTNNQNDKPLSNHLIDKPESLKAVFKHLSPKHRLQVLLNSNDSGQNLLHLTANRPRSFQTILKYLSSEELLKVLLTKDQNEKPLYHYFIDKPKSLKAVFECLTPENRVELLHVQDALGQNLLHLTAHRADSLKAILKYLPKNEPIQALQLKDAKGKTPLHHLAFTNKPELVETAATLLPNSEALLLKIMHAMQQARNNYIEHHKNRENVRFQRGHQSGFFSAWRHGDEGKTNALTFCQGLFQATSATEAIEQINTLLMNSEAYHTHSFTSYVLDELYAIVAANKLDNAKPKHYTKQQWQEIKKDLEDLCPEIENSEKKVNNPPIF